MVKNLNLREAVALVGSALLEEWQESHLDALPLPSPETVESAIEQLRIYANKHGASLQSLLAFKKNLKRHVKGVHRPTLSQYLDVLKFPALLEHDFSKGIPATYTTAYRAYAAQQQALGYLRELLGSEKLEARYTKASTAETQPLPASLIRENMVMFDIRKNRINLLGEIEGVLSVTFDALRKLLQSESVIKSLHAPAALPSITRYASTTKNNKRMMTPEEVAKKLGYSVKTLAEWRSRESSTLKYKKQENGRIRYDSDDVDAFMEAQDKA